MRAPRKALFIALILLVTVLQFPLAIIPQAKADTDTWQVEANDDDCYRRLTVDDWGLDPIRIYAGSSIAEAKQFGGGIRFIGVTIPRGSTIDSAYFKVTSGRDDAVITCRTRISGHDVDNSGTFTDKADFDDRYANHRTTAIVDWNNIPAWTLNEYGADTFSPDIKAVIQEIINRDGWVSGNALSLFWEDFDDRSDLGAIRRGHSHDGDPAKAARLEVTWTPPPPPADPNLLFGAGFNASSPYVELHWNHSLVNVQFFEVQNSTDKISWDYLGQNTTAEYHDFQVVNGTERYYRVRACNFTYGNWYNSSFTDINLEKVYFIITTEAAEAGDTIIMGAAGVFWIILIILVPIIGYVLKKG